MPRSAVLRHCCDRLWGAAAGGVETGDSAPPTGWASRWPFSWGRGVARRLSGAARRTPLDASPRPASQQSCDAWQAPGAALACLCVPKTAQLHAHIVQHPILLVAQQSEHGGLNNSQCLLGRGDRHARECARRFIAGSCRRCSRQDGARRQHGPGRRGGGRRSRASHPETWQVCRRAASLADLICYNRVPRRKCQRTTYIGKSNEYKSKGCPPRCFAFAIKAAENGLAGPPRRSAAHSRRQQRRRQRKRRQAAAAV